MMEQLSGFLSGAPGGAGTKDYEKLDNKPSVNGVELSGNKTAQDLGLLDAGELDQALQEIEGKIPDLSGMENAISEMSGLVEEQGSTLEEFGEQLEELWGIVEGFADGNEVAF